nr:uncharacterized protein LOC117835274 [Setaria viridis]
MLPPLPDASIVLTSEHGEERFEEVEVYKDILAYGRVIEPGEEAMAGKKVGPEEGEAAGVKKGCWEVAWRSVPLVIHDEGLVRAIVDLAPDLGDVSTWVSTAAIRDVLKEHPGPVNCIRVEVSKCPSPKLVRKWMKLIRAKKRGHPLQELVLVNRNRPADEAFHLRLLPDGPGGLRKLSLGFFALKPLDAGHLSLCPAVLRLMGCDLSALLLELRALQLLVLVCCHVTSECGPEGLTIVSSSLTRLEMALCTASGGIRLDYAPRLTILSAGVRPLGTGGQLRLDLRTLGALRELHGLTILLHDLGTSTLPSSCSLHCVDQLPVIISSPVSAVDDPEPEPMDPDPPQPDNSWGAPPHVQPARSHRVLGSAAVHALSERTHRHAPG